MAATMQNSEAGRLDGEYDDVCLWHFHKSYPLTLMMQDEYLRDIEGDRIHKGHYYAIRLPDGRELGSRPYTT